MSFRTMIGAIAWVTIGAMLLACGGGDGGSADRDDAGDTSDGADADLFREMVGYETGLAPYALAIGDLNGDAAPDVVVANYEGNFSAFLNNGDGTFADQIISPRPGGEGAYPVGFGDLNGDDRLDVATGTVEVNVLFNEGDGVFTAAGTYALGGASHSVVIGDLNGDEMADLGIGNNAVDNMEVVGAVSVFINDGDGNSFGPEAEYPTGATRPGHLAIGDLDGDDDEDLATTEIGTGPRPGRVMLNDGGGTFTQGASYAIDEGAMDAAPAIGDLDGDASPDLVVSLPGAVGVLLNDGGATFGSIQRYPVDWAGAIAIGDVDQDGDSDLAEATFAFDGSVGVIINDGDGRFASQRLYGSAGVTTDTVVAQPAVAIGDLDGDTKADLAMVLGAAPGMLYVLLHAP